MFPGKVLARGLLRSLNAISSEDARRTQIELGKFLTELGHVADNEGDVSPLVRQLAEALYTALQGLLKYL